MGGGATTPRTTPGYRTSIGRGGVFRSYRNHFRPLFRQKKNTRDILKKVPFSCFCAIV